MTCCKSWVLIGGARFAWLECCALIGRDRVSFVWTWSSDTSQDHIVNDMYQDGATLSPWFVVSARSLISTWRLKTQQTKILLSVVNSFSACRDFVENVGICVVCQLNFSLAQSILFEPEGNAVNIKRSFINILTFNPSFNNLKSVRITLPF